MNRHHEPDPRFAAWLAERAPRSAPEGLLQRAMKEVDQVTQEGAWLARWPMLRFASQIGVVAAVLVLATGVALMYSMLQPPVGGPDVSPAPSVEASASASPSNSAAPAQSAEPQESASASPTSPEAFPDGQRCTNPDVGYTVVFPAGWFASQHVEGGVSDDVAACRFFSPQAFEVRPASQASDIAVAMGVQAQADGAREAGETTTVGGRRATRLESESDGGWDPPGTRYYSYWIELDDGTWLLASTSDGPGWVGDYDENKAILDAMMDSLQFTR